MAITTTFENQVKSRYNPRFGTIDEFEQYYLQDLAERSMFNWNYYTDRDGKERVIEPINHFPELKEYEVWCEGYQATGEHGTAHLWGKAKARCFAQACHIVLCRSFLENAEQYNDPSYSGYIDSGRWDYDPNRLSYWGCSLYWSEELAKKSFG